MVYDELHLLAHRYLRKQQNPDLLQTTVLVHEAYLRLVGEDFDWQGRDHFFAVASTVMRRIMVDFARQRYAKKRGSGQFSVPLEDVQHQLSTAPEPEAELLALHAALEDLARLDARKARILELRFFGGLAIRETARVLGISTATVEREMKLLKESADLVAELQGRAHPEYADYLENYARTLQQAGRSIEAETLHRQVLATLAKLGDEGAQRMPWVLINLGDTLLELKRFDEGVHGRR